VSDPHLAQARERLGHVLKDRWVLEDVLGVGGMAAVYAARHRNGARAAIKLLHGPLSEDQVVRERFLREAYLANSLEHAGTVHVLDDDADPKLGPFLVMELLDGQSLLELLDAGVTFDGAAVLDIANQALDVLASAHERGIVHRDLKPANLFLCRNGQIKVLDFGIARILDGNQARLTRTGVPLGTPAYMAPEQARGQGREADGRADVYALGATLFRLLTGRHVHLGRGAEQIAKVATMRAGKVREAAPQVPPYVAAVIDRSLEFEPERRYATARDMQSDVRALLRGEIPPIASRPLPEPGPVPALPSITPKRRGVPNAPPESRRDDVSAIAESLRQRAKEAARRPDAFMIDEATDEEQEEDENMPTLVGSPREMILGARPRAESEMTPARPRQNRLPPPRRNPLVPQQGTPARSAEAGSAVWGSAAAQAFARVPNVPVPQAMPPSSVPMSRPIVNAPPSPRIVHQPDPDDVDLDAPTIARGDARALLAQLEAAKRGARVDVGEPIPASSPMRGTQRRLSSIPFSPPSIPPVSQGPVSSQPISSQPAPVISAPPVALRAAPITRPPLQAPTPAPAASSGRRGLLLLLLAIIVLVPSAVVIYFQLKK